MLKLLVITLVCASVVLASSRLDEIKLTRDAQAVRPDGPDEKLQFDRDNRGSWHSGQDSRNSPGPSSSKSSNTNLYPINQEQNQSSSPRRDKHGEHDLDDHFSQQKGQQARPSQPSNSMANNIDFNGHF